MSVAMTNPSTNPAQSPAPNGVAAGVSGAARVDVPRLPYALIMVGVGAVASGLAWMLAGSDPQRAYAAAIVAVGGLIALMPAIMSVPPTRWGIVVFATFTVRNLLFVAAMLAVVQLVEGIDRRPFLFGVVAGAGLILLVETMLAIGILSWLDRNKVFAQRSADQATR
jgi:hypothetical protein